MNLAYSIGLSTKPSLVYFHSLLNSHIQTKNPKQALLIFRHLFQHNLKPSDLTFSLLLKACTSSPSYLDLAKSETEPNQIHTHLIKSGVNRYVYVGTALLDLYMKLGNVRNAQKLFDDMPERDDVTWNAVICGVSRNGHHSEALELFVQMCREGFSPRHETLVSLVPSCGRQELAFQGKSVHGFGIKAGIDSDSQVKNALTSMYGKCADLEAAEVLFEENGDKSVVSWNTMIGAYGQNGCFGEAMLVFKRMLVENVQANVVTIVSILSANPDPEFIHCHATKTGLVNNASVITSLICEYVVRGNTGSGELLYKALPQKTLVSLTVLISSYAERGDMGEVMECFAHLQQLEMKLDAVAMVSILHGIKHSADFDIGLAFYGYGLKTGLTTDSLVVNGLISMYSRFDNMEDAFLLFYEMRERPLVTWNSLISGCVQAGRSSDALELFSQMKMSGHSPDSITISSLLSGCCQLEYLRFGEVLHTYVLRSNSEEEDFVETALIDMYAKCGRIEHAERVFKSIKEPCLGTWNSMISAYSVYGAEHKALLCFSEMQERGLQPDKITFLGVLASCTHASLVHEGRTYFQMMKEMFNLTPTLQHCACMVHLFGRAGFFNEALMFIRDTEIKPDFAVWGALLNACCIHQEVKLGEYIAKKMFFLDSKNGGFLVLMSNLYAAERRWEDVARVREMIRENGGDGSSGISVIEQVSIHI